MKKKPSTRFCELGIEHSPETSSSSGPTLSQGPWTNALRWKVGDRVYALWAGNNSFYASNSGRASNERQKTVDLAVLWLYSRFDQLLA